MLDPKVAQDARQAWDKFMQQVNRMECRMLTAMADQIDKQWAEMFPPVAISADQPPKPSGVAAASATAADVARSVAEIENERHDAATCCGERQEPAKPVEIDGDRPYVVEGWREIRRRYLRRVTPDVASSAASQPVSATTGTLIEITPAAVSAMYERNERDALFQRIENLKVENHEQQKKTLQVCLENERLRSEVARLRLTEEERESVQRAAAFLTKLADRHGGGE